MNFNEAENRNVRPNRLSKSDSPYLRQHQYNPVDWYPWCDEAFEKAKKENKPIFLSIGYSSCHWCHVMAHETFEDVKIAEFLNKYFVSIKVDREERPDIDRVYMNFVQVTTGYGGWPLSVFLTPEGKPFFGGTYFPPYSKHGRLGFMEVLEQVHRAWRERGEAVANSANEVLNQFKQWFEYGIGGESPPSSNAVHIAANSLKSSFDMEYGGFGDSPKFPQSSALRFLLFYGMRHNDSVSLNMAFRACKAMALGGIHDKLGGGFHRYAVDRQWILPHFEKMLYDNALLLLLYSEAYLIGKIPIFSDTASSIVNYLAERLRSDNGGFYSAEDADSEGEEGRYYLWFYDEVKGILTPDEFELVKNVFNLRAEGNFVDPIHPDENTDKNILYIAQLPSSADQALFENAMRKLKEVRDKRQKPFRDEKIIAAWNGYAIAGLSRAGFILQNPYCLKLAKDCIEFIKSNLWDSKNHVLYHSWYNGNVNKSQILEDYAAVIWGLIEYHQATLDTSTIQLAIELANSMVERFEDKEKGGFWQTPVIENRLIYNLKDSYDGAVPSENSLAATVLLRMHEITNDSRFLDSVERTFRFFSNQLNQQPASLTCMLLALDLWHGEKLKATISPESSPGFIKHYLGVLSNFYLPQLSNVDSASLEGRLGNSLRKDTVYICSDKRCFEPITDLSGLMAFLKSYEFSSQT